MKTKRILVELIEHLAEFEASTGAYEQLDMAGFIDFVQQKLGTKELKSRNNAGDQAPWLVEMGEETETMIARLVIVMNRYAKSYTKRALDGSVIQTSEEFSFLLYLITTGSMTKTELIYKNLLEKTSGMEVIKRLLKLGLIEEFDDEKDKRSKRIALSPKGRQELLRILPIMQRVTHLVAGNLTAQERQTLAYLLNKLDHYHHDIFVNDRQTPFDDLTLKYNNRLS